MNNCELENSPELPGTGRIQLPEAREGEPEMVETIELIRNREAWGKAREVAAAELAREKAETRG